MPIKYLIKYLQKTVRLDILDEHLSKPLVRVLDIGCGNHSALIMKQYYPKCEYYGLDKDKNDFKSMSGFYEIDLNEEPEKTDLLPNNFSIVSL